MTDNENLKGTITCTYKIVFEADNDIKEGTSFKSAAVFDSTVELHTKSDKLNAKLLSTVKEKFPSEFKQTTLEDH